MPKIKCMFELYCSSLKYSRINLPIENRNIILNQIGSMYINTQYLSICDKFSV